MASGLELAGEEEVYGMPSASGLLRVSLGPCSTDLRAYLQHGIHEPGLLVGSRQGPRVRVPWVSAGRWKGAKGRVVVMEGPRTLRAVLETKHQ